MREITCDVKKPLALLCSSISQISMCVSIVSHVRCDGAPARQLTRAGGGGVGTPRPQTPSAASRCSRSFSLGSADLRQPRQKRCTLLRCSWGALLAVFAMDHLKTLAAA
jgi:hypothetical protein